MSHNLPPHLTSLQSPPLTPHLTPHLHSQLTNPPQVSGNTAQKDKKVSDDEDEKKEGEDVEEKKGDEPKIDEDGDGDKDGIAQPTWTRNADNFIQYTI